MKHLLAGLMFLPLTAFAIEQQQLERMLATAATAETDAYIEVRDAVVDMGTNATPLLAAVATDTKVSWRERLAARIWYERIARKQDIETLLAHDWRSYPPYRGILQPGQRWMSATGPAFEMGPYVVPKCIEVGLWYYYVELAWKKTEACPTLKPRPDRKFSKAWPAWCREALKGQAEERYLSLARIERLQNDPALDDRENVQFYRELLKTKDAETVPVLIDRYDAFNRREVIGPELFSGRHAELYRGMFDPILSFADSRHADLLEKFINNHPALADLKPKMVDVRARPAPSPKPEPPFRLGATSVRTP